MFAVGVFSEGFHMYMRTDDDLIFHLECIQFFALLLHTVLASYAGPTTMER